MRRLLGSIAVLAIALSGCNSGADGDTDSLRVVVTTTVLGDVVSNVAGDAVMVEVLVPIGADPHDFQLSARQAAALQTADLVVVNGLGLEDGLRDVLESAASEGANVFEVAPLLDPLPFAGDHEHEEEDHEDEGDEALDPHVWLDPIRMADAARLLGEELAELDPEGGHIERATEYAARLEAVDEDVRAILAGVDETRRKLVTNHDALGYFADRYGLTIVGVVIPGGSTLAEPSSADLAALVDTMRTEGVTAIFGETTEPRALADAVADAAGADVVVVELLTGSLGGPGSGAETLVDMLLSNATLIADALG